MIIADLLKEGEIFSIVNV